jgi:hypothetical protein
MKAFSIACEEAFHLRFKGISFQDDTSIHVWREAWNAALVAVDTRLEELRHADHK